MPLIIHQIAHKNQPVMRFLLYKLSGNLVGEWIEEFALRERERERGENVGNEKQNEI